MLFVDNMRPKIDIIFIFIIWRNLWKIVYSGGDNSNDDEEEEEDRDRHSGTGYDSFLDDDDNKRWENWKAERLDRAKPDITEATCGMLF